MINWIKCLLGFHDPANAGGQYNWCDRCDVEIKNTCSHEWEAPDNGCCGKRYGERVCAKCDRVETLTVKFDGTSKWVCTDASLTRLGKVFEREAALREGKS